MSQPRLTRLTCDSGYMIKRTPPKEKQKKWWISMPNMLMLKDKIKRKKN